jgi:hypothetical protein
MKNDYKIIQDLIQEITDGVISGAYVKSPESIKEYKKKIINLLAITKTIDKILMDILLILYMEEALNKVERNEEISRTS